MSNTATRYPGDAEPVVNMFAPTRLVTYFFILLGIILLTYGVVNLNNWRILDPETIAQARVDKEQGLTKAEEVSLYTRQLEAASAAKGQFLKIGLLFVVLGLFSFWLSRNWQSWRGLFSEYMLYAYSFLVPPLGWILFLGAYPTRGDKNRKIVRKNIGIMSIALPVGYLAYYVTLLLQAYVLSPLGNSIATSGFLVAIFNFLLTIQVAQFVGIFAGAFVAYRTKDVRAISVAGQLVVLAVVLAILGWLGGNAAYGIESRGLSATDFGFLRNTASFDISEHLIPYDRTYTYGRAFLVGALNTLLVSVLGIFFATIVGLIVGIARLSSNWLMSTLARVFVELMRNVPLLVLLFFIYAGVLLQLPHRDNSIRLFGERVWLNNRGVAVPWFKPTETFSAWVPYLIAAVIIAGVIWYFRNRTYPTTGRPAFSWWYVLLGFAVVSGTGIFITHPLLYQVPSIQGFNFAKDENQKYIGMVMTPEFFGVLSGLVLYTGAYIGEVVRAGIQAVSKGQREAATALGLSQSQSLQLIILPQALQVIIPPLTNQYLNLAKNSSLAIAVGYADLFAVANTTFNQSGQSVQVILLMMATYLALSLTISVIMNFINSRVKIKER